MLWIWPNFIILVIFPGGIKEANKAVVQYLAYKLVLIDSIAGNPDGSSPKALSCHTGCIR